MSNPQQRYFAVTAPGLEQICADELAELGIDGLTVLVGGVEFDGGLRELYLANLQLRSASRILARIGELQARDFPALFKRLLRLPWGRFVKPGSRYEIRASCHRSRLSHSGRVEETCRRAINQALGTNETDGAAVATILLRLDNDRCQVSIDSSGGLLSRRGYRVARGTAPLRENLAAASLLRLGYDGTQPLVDAMTGAGTFAIEAALIALNRAPGKMRTFAFMDWPKYRAGLWQQLLQQAEQTEKTVPAARIVAVDSNPKAIVAAERNLEAAGLSGLVELCCRPMQELVPETRTGLLICNPPYGQRLGQNATLRALYRDIGRVYGETFAGWRGALVCPDNELIRSTGLRFERLCRFSNGGIKVALLEKTDSA